MSEASREDQRPRVLKAAMRILARGDGLSMRQLAASVGASTMMLYTLFGSREAVLEALFDEMLIQMGDALQKVESPDSFSYVVRLAYAYREYALNNLAFVWVVFHAPRAVGMAGARIRESRAFAVLIRGIEKCIAEGLFLPAEARALADQLWTLVNGIVMLEVAGYFPDRESADQHFFQSGQSFLRGLMVAPESMPIPQLT